MKKPIIPIRISNELYERLKEEAKSFGISLSQVIRNHISEYQGLRQHAELLKKIERKLDSLSNPSAENLQDTQFLHQENNLLIRKIARHLNSQIVLEVDEKLALNKEKSNEHT